MPEPTVDDTLPRIAVVTTTHARDSHLHRQRVGLAGNPPFLHVVVGMGERPHLADVGGGLPTTTLSVPVPTSGLPLAAARNAGAAEALDAGAELVVMLDVDCIPAPVMLERYARASAAVDHPALLCGPVAYLPPSPPGGYPTSGLTELSRPHPARPVPADGQLAVETRYELFWSLSFAVTATTWTGLGGFCEDYTGYGGEDTDFALTAEAAGIPMYWVGGALAHHQHHVPTRTTPGRVDEIVRNAHTFHGRWGRWPMGGWLTEMAADGLVEFDADRDVLRVRTC
jgi:hypothetical protein